MSIVRRIIVASLAGSLPFGALAQDDENAAPVKPIPAEIMPLAAKSLLLDVAYTGARYVAVGERGHIVVSLDGQKWAQAPAPTRATLNAVTFTDENNGWAVGHDATILNTRDGGRSWQIQNFEPEREKPFIDVLFLDNNRGFAVGAYSLMFATSDGGATWEEFDSPIREDEWHFNSIIPLANGNLFIAGESGTLAISSDEGETWESVETPYESSFFGAAAFGSEGVAIFGLRGNAFHTSSASEPDWNKIDTGNENSLIGGATLDSGEIVMVGINGIIMQSSGGLSGVESLDNPVGITLAAVQPVKGGLLVVGEAGTQLIRQ